MHPQNTQDQAPADAVERAARLVHRYADEHDRVEGSGEAVEIWFDDGARLTSDDLRMVARAALATAMPTTTPEWGVARVDPWNDGKPDYQAMPSEREARSVAGEYRRATVYVVSREVTDWREVTP